MAKAYLNQTFFCKSLIKSRVRGHVCNVFKRFASPIINNAFNGSQERFTIYSLPCDLWELEQLAADTTQVLDSLLPASDNKFALHCFENDNGLYRREKHSRSFMLNEEIFYRHVQFDYHNELLYANRHATENFFGWFDFTGIPMHGSKASPTASPADLDIILDHNNFVKNSVVFITASLSWRRAENMPRDMFNQARTESELHGGKACWYAARALEDYLAANTPMKPFMSIEYQNDNQRTPMVLLGLSNNDHVLSHYDHVFEDGVHRESINFDRDKNKPKQINQAASIQPELDFSGSLTEDLKSSNFSLSQLCSAYGKTPREVGATKAHLTRKGIDSGYSLT